MATELEELIRQVDEAEWGWLRAHLERGGLVVVAQGLELAEAGLKVVADDTGAVGEWIRAGLLARPTLQEIKAWDRERGKRFRTLIVSPYVLIQEIEQTREVIN